MKTFAALYQNYADTAALSGGSYTLPLSNALHPDIGRVARTTNAATGSTYFSADLGASRPVGGVAIGPTNLTPGSLYRIRAFSDAGQTTVVYDSGSLLIPGSSTMDWADTSTWVAWENPGFWAGTSAVQEATYVPVWASIIFDADVAARYWRVDFTDPGNADGYVQFGRALIGRVYRPSVNYEYGAEMGNVPVSQRKTTLGGRNLDRFVSNRRTLRVSFTLLPETELFQHVFRFQYQVGVAGQVFVAPEPDDQPNFQKRSFLATMKTPPSIVQAMFDAGTTVFDFEEVL